MSEPDGLDEFRRGFRALCRDLEAELAARGPVCELSGRCCRFEEYGHTLFLSEPEAKLLVADAPPPGRPLDDGATCPWQHESGRCEARGARPLGCRLYYCDPSFEAAMPEVSEEYISRLKRLVDSLGLPWNYAPLHRNLRHLLGSDGSETDSG